MTNRCVIKDCEQDATTLVSDKKDIYKMSSCDEHINAVGKLLGNDIQTNNEEEE